MSVKDKRRLEKRKKRQKKKEQERIHKSVAPIPPKNKIKQLPYIVIKLLTGANVAKNYNLNRDAVGIIWDNDVEQVSLEDFEIAQKIADELYKEQVKEKSLMSSINTLSVGMTLHKLATRKIEKLMEHRAGNRKKILFVKDRSGCGYWRMWVPSRYMDTENLYIDITETELVFDYLLEYDVIVVQRLCNWRDYYLVERLKRHGKRVVYDIDDDIFDIPDDNPAVRFVKKDQHKSAWGIMRLCDAVTTTSEILKERLRCPKETTFVIPNAIDLDDGYPCKFQGSDDGLKRILWMGGSSHDRDWLECYDAVDRIFREREDVRLVVYGELPKVIKAHMIAQDKAWWQNRLEYMQFQEVETYVEMTKEIKAEVALAPLAKIGFNFAKSEIRYLEYTGAGIPTVASDVTPYRDCIENGKDGYLVSNTDEWYEAITMFLDNSDKCSRVVDEAVNTVNEHFDVKKIVHDWEEAILGQKVYEVKNEPQLAEVAV